MPISELVNIEFDCKCVKLTMKNGKKNNTFETNVLEKLYVLVSGVPDDRKTSFPNTLTTVVGLRVVLSPLFSRKAGGIVARLTTLDSLEVGGPPQAFKVIADKTDAWTTYKDLPLGMVYVQRSTKGELTVFSATCPHLGCVVEFRNTEKDGEHFFCPCHESSFNVDGSLAPNNTQAKRGLDTLEIDQEKLVAGEVWVRFRKFKANIVEKKPIT